MNESLKSICIFIMLVGGAFAIVGWTAQEPGAISWVFRIGGPILAITMLAFVVKQHMRRDLAPDYLRQYGGNYFNRGGFCFAVAITNEDGIGSMDLFFQNQYDSPCLGRVALRPARNLLAGRANIEHITFDIKCEPGAFGLASLPIPIPKKYQGKRVSFEAGASVQYPNGKGQALRYHQGIPLGTNSDFGDGFKNAVQLAGAAVGVIVLSKPAKIEIKLPKGVAEELGEIKGPEVNTLWRWGDSPLKRIA